MDNEIFESLREEFYLESRERLDQIADALLSLGSSEAGSRESILVGAKRELHTLKGNSGMMGLVELQDLAHSLEDQITGRDVSAQDIADVLAGIDRFRALLDEACGRGPTESGQQPGEFDDASIQESVRVSFSALDHLVDLLSEMVIFRNRLTESLGKGLELLEKKHRSSLEWREVEGALDTLNTTLDQIRKGVMELRMVPLGSLFSQLRRIVFDESAANDRAVDLHVFGGDTPLDKALLEVANEAMGHLVRNAVVHGIEPPAVREKKGKPSRGRITVGAAAQGEEVIIDIEDDGAGLDREALLAAAQRAGMDLDSSIDLQTLAFLPGLSTQTATSRSSGRGMGTAAVVEAVRRRGGQVELHTAPDVGTRFRLRLPLTASILRALLVSVDGEEYAIPLSAVQESQMLGSQGHQKVDVAESVRWRGQLVPVLDLGCAFGTAQGIRSEGYVVLIEAEGRYRGLVVDEILGVRDMVFKSLEELASRATGVSGCTILGDGRVMMILDPPELTTLSTSEERTA